MKKTLIFLTSLVLIGCSNSNVQSNIKKDDKISQLREYNTNKDNLSPKRRIVIGKIKNYSRFGTERNNTLGKDILISEFSNTGRFTILEREDLDVVLEELNFSSNLGQDTLAMKQKFLDTDYIIVGSVTKYNLNTTGAKNIFSKSKTQRAEVNIELKVIDVLNGKVWSETGEGSSEVEFSTILGAGTYGSYTNLEEEAYRAAIIQGIEKIVEKIDATPWSSAIIQKKGNKLIINSGIENNLKLGTEVNIYKQGEAIEYRGEILGYNEEFLGVGKVVSHIGTSASVVEYTGKDFKLPGIVKLK